VKRGICIWATCGSLALLGMTPLQGQTISGAVRDSTSRALVAGVVVELHNAGGDLLSRTLTNSSGAFQVFADPRAATLKVLRIGFRPRDIRIQADTLQGRFVEIGMARLPTMLDRMAVVAGAKCDQRTNPAGQALLQQARAGLLATIVGREVNPAKLVRLSYERTLGGRLDTMMPSMWIDSVNESKATFRAARRGADLVTRGFTADSLGTGIYFGPDAEVLLDEGFEAGYCFYVTERRGQVGLGFSPASSRRIGRVDVEGVLWIDKDERALRSLEYRYVGVGREAEDRNVGGDLTYQEMPNGAVIVSRWTLRLLKVRVDSQMYKHGRLPTARIVVSEGGGLVARAEWPDSTKWSTELGTLEVTAIDGESGRLVPGTEVRLRKTNFVATTDEHGVARFTNVFPGRYAMDVSNHELEDLGFIRELAVTNAGPIDSAVVRASLVQADTGSELLQKTVDVFAGRTARATAPMRTTRQFAAATCRDPGKDSSPKRAILGKLTFANGNPSSFGWVYADALGRRVQTWPGGGFAICVPDSWTGSVKLQGLAGRLRTDETVVELGNGLTILRLTLRPPG
jgi:hypothetical protein